ncbi:hypothetical protein O1611_g6121 [Lasiodiplodia mahajangana]|uniref:Uncharacterized protein n=1 Tax=Lasiodiplodia mahajangana TaxID=1108764 RepID=A0ACC2JJ28_9PEZI|nr:hypothetical protein O1611_g6121 [Lasiodiplodia mahajangana]
MYVPQGRIYTRAYSSKNAGQLVSGKGRAGHTLSRKELSDEFDRHRDLGNRKPTALVSVSIRILDTVRRAYEKRFEGEEPAADIWIVFIEVPDGSSDKVHEARDLAKILQLLEPNKFLYERVIEWEIPEEWVLHRVSLQTLFDHGLDWHERYFTHRWVPPTEELRKKISSDLDFDTGNWTQFAVDFARQWGNGAPMGWIVLRLLKDCHSAHIFPGVIEGIPAIQYWSSKCDMEAPDSAPGASTANVDDISNLFQQLDI